MSIPLTVSELVERARQLGGRTVGELARAQGLSAPADLRRAKGFVGRLVEQSLGLKPSNDSAPDFRELGIELKTIPIGRDGAPCESTFVCRIPLAALSTVDWSESPVRRKLARVLWMPVEGDREIPVPVRRIGRALLWEPSPQEESDLRADWDELVGRLGADDPRPITAHLGKVLQVRPKAPNSRVLGRARDEDDVLIAAAPRGFYLRSSFTQKILARAETVTVTTRASHQHRR